MHVQINLFQPNGRKNMKRWYTFTTYYIQEQEIGPDYKEYHLEEKKGSKNSDNAKAKSCGSRGYNCIYF